MFQEIYNFLFAYLPFYGYRGNFRGTFMYTCFPRFLGRNTFFDTSWLQAPSQICFTIYNLGMEFILPTGAYPYCAYVSW